jgi:predicted lipoprotein with Yx(FWY)xxD motif
MKLTIMVSGLLMAANASALTVHDRDIHGKTNLTTTAVRSVQGKQKTILVDKDGFSLYTFTEDKPNVSNCSGGCLNEWPPQHAPAGSQVEAPYGTIQGNDGQPQLTLDSQPLYHYDDDKKAGDTFGVYPEWDVIEVIN